MGQIKYVPPQPQNPALQGQTMLERLLGIEKGSPWDWRSLEEVGKDVLPDVKEAWRQGTTAPLPSGRINVPPAGAPRAFQTPGESASASMASNMPPTPPDTLGGKGFRSLGGDQYAVRGAYGAPPVQGSASFGGPKFNTFSAPRQEAALSGLKQASSQFQQPYIPSEDLFRQAAARPQVIGSGEDAYEIPTVAPGASAWATSQLQDRGLITGGRGFEEAKMRIPLQEAEINAQGGMAQQREQSRGALDVAREQQRGMGDRAQAMTELYGLIGGGRSFSIPGVGSVGAAPQTQRVPQALLSQVTAARSALEQERARSFGDPARAEAVYRQAIGQVYGQDPATPELKELAAAIALNPETSNLSLSQILSEFDFDGANVNLNDPAMQQDLDRLLNYARGVVGGQ